MMSRLNLKNNFDLCYPILEKEFDLVYNKINSTLDKRVLFYELRIDYLFENGIGIDDIIAFINDLIKHFSDKKFIITIRTKSEGGATQLSFNEYYNYLEKLITNVEASYIDIEYKYYILDKSSFDSLIKTSKSKIILSKHIFDGKFSSTNCEETINELLEGPGDIAKLAIMVSTKDDLFSFMNIAKDYASLLKKNKKEAIFIAMGEMGRLSRIYPEYTNTKIVFINAYDKGSILGQYSLGSYLENRKLLAKLSKN